eukprot:2584081-Rhodomonas_salina.1
MAGVRPKTTRPSLRPLMASMTPLLAARGTCCNHVRARAASKVARLRRSRSSTCTGSARLSHVTSVQT